MKNDRQQQFALAVSAAFGVGLVLVLASRNKSASGTASSLAKTPQLASLGLLGGLKRAANHRVDNLLRANERFTDVMQKVLRVI